LEDFKRGVDPSKADFVSDFKQLLTFLEKYKLINIDDDLRQNVINYGKSLQNYIDNESDSFPKLAVDNNIIETIINHGFCLDHLIECNVEIVSIANQV
jgi:hypothetical protein